VDGRALWADFLALYANAAFGIVNMVRLTSGREPDESQFEPLTLAMAALGASADHDLDAARTRLHAMAAAYDRWFETIDVALTPVLLTPPVGIGHIAGDLGYEVAIQRISDFCDYTILHNIAGAPAVSLPLHWTADGLPVGLQFAARAGDERTLFELAFELEAAMPWAARRPPAYVD
jgi:amidase